MPASLHNSSAPINGAALSTCGVPIWKAPASTAGVSVCSISNCFSLSELNQPASPGETPKWFSCKYKAPTLPGPPFKCLYVHQNAKSTPQSCKSCGIERSEERRVGKKKRDGRGM